MNVSKLTRFTCIGMLSAIVLTACSANDDNANGMGSLTPEEQAFGKATGNFTAEEWYPRGALGTTEKASYSAPTPAVTHITGMEDSSLVKASSRSSTPSSRSLARDWDQPGCATHALPAIPATDMASARQNIVPIRLETAICWSSIILTPMATSPR